MLKRSLCCILSTIIVASVMLVAPSPVSKAQDPCDQLVPSRLQAGITARVVFDGDGLGVVFRDNPGKEQSGSNILRALPEGEVVSIVDGPVCLDAAIWWNVELATGERGWVAEGDVRDYFLEPFTVSVFVYEPDSNNPRQLNRWLVDDNGNIQEQENFTVPSLETLPARDLWQPPDLDAANATLAERRATCPQVLAGTPWETVSDAGDVMVPDAQFEYYPSPDGGKFFVVRHRVVLMPSCDEAPGTFYGVSTVHVISNQGSNDLFPYGQHSGARSKEACLSPDVTNLSWTTYLSQVAWSPDSDTVAFTARYLDTDAGGRPCAFYFTFMVDAFAGGVIPIAEGRRIGWGEGGTRLYYFTQTTDNGYNVTEDMFWQLSNGQTTRLGLPENAEPLPPAFDSTGVYLPWTDDGRQALICNGPTNCPSVFSFDILDRQTTPSVTTPEVFQAFQVRNVFYVAGDTRLLWLTSGGEVYLQGILGVDAGNWEAVSLRAVNDSSVIDVSVMPGGITAILHLEDGRYALLNTISRELQPLGTLDNSGQPNDPADTSSPGEDGDQ